MFALLQGGCQPAPALTITLGGDVILGRDGEAIFTENPWGGLAQNGSENRFVVNLESPLASGGEVELSAGEGYDLCAPAESAEILDVGGVDVVTTANNHQLDCGEKVEAFQAEEGFRVILEGKPEYLESSAGTIALLAVDAVSKPLDMDLLLESVAELKGESDVLIVSLHWGVEYAGGPTPLQREQAQQLANAGVDILWGHHPHVLQPIEWVESEDGTHRMLAIYSLGNLLTDQMMTLETRRSALVQVQIRGVEISQLSFRPLVMTQSDGKLMLASPSEVEVIQIKDRLDWEQLMESLP